MLKEILKERDLLPVVKMNDGSDATPENWQERRQEMLNLLQEYSYGYTPECCGEGRGEVMQYVHQFVEGWRIDTGVGHLHREFCKAGETLILLGGQTL